MRKIRSLVVLMIIAVLVMSFAACGQATPAASSSAPAVSSSEPAQSSEAPSASASTSAASGKTFKIGVCTPNNKVPFFARLVQGMIDNAKALNCELVIQDAGDDTNTQINQVDTFIAQKVDMIILMPTQLEALIPSAKKCNESGVPFMTVNRMLSAKPAKDSGVNMVTYVGADDYTGGQSQGQMVQQIVEKAGKKDGKILLIQGTLGSSPQIMREKGLEEYLAKNTPDIKIVAKQASGQDQTKAITVMQNFLTSYAAGTVDAVVVQDPYSAVGACDAIAQANRSDLLGKVIAFDYPQECVDYIKAGKMYGSVLQDPYKQGVVGIQTAAKFLNEGQSDIGENTYTDLPFVNVDNVSQYPNAAW